MIKMVMVGVWVSIITLGSFYGSMVWVSGQPPEMAPTSFFGKVEKIKTETISVPIISNGEISGYVLAKFTFLADAILLKLMSVPPELILSDEAFRAIYSGSLQDFKKLEKYDLATLTKRMRLNANARIGVEIVKDVLVDSISYIPKSELRKRGRKKE